MVTIIYQNYYYKILLAILALFFLLTPSSCAFQPKIIFGTENLLRLANSDYYEETSSSKKRGRIRPKRILSPQRQKIELERQQLQVISREESLKDPTLLSTVKFSDRTDLHPLTKRALTEIMGLQEMTEVQAKTFPVAVSGASLVGQARTGTGKTLGFLLPISERLREINVYPPGGKTIGALVIAPTRELALQISEQAETVLKYHHDISVACIYGGTKMGRDINIFRNKRGLPSILVATPGRLLDHVKETKLSGYKFADIIGTTKILVLDEMDALLDMGFKNDIMQLLSYLPRRRQTMLFSATLPRKLKRSLGDVMGKDYQEIICVDEKDIKTSTNARVEQYYMMLPSMDHYVSTLTKIVQEEINRNSKIVIFLPTTKFVAFFATYFEKAMDMPNIYRLHSRMSQSARQRASQAFRTIRNRAVLVTTDISSRGIDYPDITLVIQYGTPKSDDTYIHRLGRTGRAGKEGTGLQVLLPFESEVVQKLKNRGLREKSFTFGGKKDDRIEKAFQTVRSGDALLTPAAQGAYKSFLAFYLERIEEFQMTPKDVVTAANSFSEAVGLVYPPELEEKTASSLGISHIVRTTKD